MRSEPISVADAKSEKLNSLLQDCDISNIRVFPLPDDPYTYLKPYCLKLIFESNSTHIFSKFPDTFNLSNYQIILEIPSYAIVIFNNIDDFKKIDHVKMEPGSKLIVSDCSLLANYEINWFLKLPIHIEDSSNMGDLTIIEDLFN